MVGVFLAVLAAVGAFGVLILVETVVEFLREGDRAAERGVGGSRVRPPDLTTRTAPRGVVESIDRRLTRRVELQRRTWTDGQLNPTPRARLPKISRAE